MKPIASEQQLKEQIKRLKKELSKEKKDHLITADELNKAVKENLLLHAELFENSGYIEYLENQIDDVHREIDLAPKDDDGEPLILYGRINYPVYGLKRDPCYAIGYYEDGEWVVSSDHGVTIEATHYIHLPEPPDRQEEDALSIEEVRLRRRQRVVSKMYDIINKTKKKEAEQ